MKTSSFLGPSITANYRPGLVGASSRSYDHRGVLTWGDIEAMKRDPQVAFGLRILYAPLPQVKWKVKAKDPAVAKYVDRTLKRLWTNHLHDLLDFVCYGHSGGEVIWKHDEEMDTIEFDRLDPVMPPDLRPLQIGRDLAGITVQGVGQGDGGPGWIRPPRSLWAIHEQTPGTLYGRSRLRAVWIPWQEKTARHGALDVRRLWFVKNVFRGGIIRHPAGTIETATGVWQSCQDYARELVEKMEAGGVLTLPNLVDEHGNQLWTYEEPKVNGDLTGVREYTGDLDTEILTALGIPPEVVKAADTGSGWSGRSVPFLVWLSSEDIIAASILKAAVEQICRPGVAVNYGEQWFEVEPVSLVPKQMTEDAAQTEGEDGDQDGDQPPPDTQPPAPPPAPPAPPPVAMSLDAPVQLAQKSPEKASSKPPEKAKEKDKAAGDWEPYTGKMGARKGQSGWKNKTSGRVVWGEKPPEKKPAAKPGAKVGKVAAKKPAGKVTLDGAKQKIAELAAGVTSADDLAAHLAELHMTDLQALKKELKLKVGGTKVEQAKAAARAAIAAAKGTAKAPTPAPVTKPSSAPAPAAKPTPAVKPAAKPVAKQADSQEVATGHPAIDGPVAAAKTPAAKVSALFDASSYFADLAVVGHMKDPNSVMQHMVSTALEGQPASVIKEAAKAVGISKPTGDVRSQIAKQMHERLQQAIRARDTIFGEKSDQADAVKRLQQHGYDVAKGAAKGVSVPKFEPVKKVIPSPKPPKPGFTGTDNLGRRWENGKLVAAKEEEPKPDSASAPDDAGQPAEQRAMDKVLASPVTKVDELRDHLGLGKEEFDALILKLADQGQLVLSQDANPAAFTPAQRAKFVQDGDSLITAVMPSDDARAGKSPKPAPAQPATPAPAPAPAPSPQAALPIGAPHPASTGRHADGSAISVPADAKFAKLPVPRDSKPNPALPDSSRPVLSGAQADAVYDYTSWAYEDVNRALRAGVSGLDEKNPALISGTFEAVQKGLAAAFAATPLITPPPIEVHRGMNFRVHEELGKFMKPLLAAAKTGGEVTLAGYSSTTTDPSAAVNFLGTTPRAVHMKIKAVHGLDVGPYSPHAAEKELLLDHNSRFRVVSVTPAAHNSYTVELEQVPTDKMLPAPATGSGPVPTPTPAGKPTPASVPATGQSAAPPPKKKKGLFSKLLSW